MEAKGDCFERAATLVAFLLDDKAMLVHGIVSGQGKLEGLRFAHGWVEVGDVVIEKSNGHDLVIPKLVYYAIGKVKETETVRYSQKEARKLMNQRGTYGPWHEIPKEILRDEEIAKQRG